jgi:hypothetical protein
MASLKPDLQVHDAPAFLGTINSTINGTLGGLPPPTSPLPPSFARLLLGTILLGFFIHRCVYYFTSELPAFGSGLKRLPGPISTLPYAGRVHDVDRMHAWNALHKFSNEYNGLFSCTLGGETHIWVAREDIANDLLCKNAAISSARADLGAYPGVTEDYKYLPLLGLTGQFDSCLRYLALRC